MRSALSRPPRGEPTWLRRTAEISSGQFVIFCARPTAFTHPQKLRSERPVRKALASRRFSGVGRRWCVQCTRCEQSSTFVPPELAARRFRESRRSDEQELRCRQPEVAKQ